MDVVHNPKKHLEQWRFKYISLIWQKTNTNWIERRRLGLEFGLCSHLFTWFGPFPSPSPQLFLNFYLSVLECFVHLLLVVFHWSYTIYLFVYQLSIESKSLYTMLVIEEPEVKFFFHYSMSLFNQDKVAFHFPFLFHIFPRSEPSIKFGIL